MHLSFKPLLAGVLVVFAGVGAAHADDALRRAQQQLRDQGFYYGAVDGSPGDETTQAIKRYQIRNGLAVTGQLNEETQKSISRTGSAAAPSPKTRSDLQSDRELANTPAVPPPLERERPPATPPVINGAPDDEDAAPPQPASQPIPRAPLSRDDRDRGQDRPAPGGVAPSAPLTSLLQGTPFEFAPPPVQSDVLRRAQIHLLRSGFYGGEPDGVPGAQTADAISEFQAANGMRRNGRLDENTLAALRLLPPGRRVIEPPAPQPRGYPPVFEGRIVR